MRNDEPLPSYDDNGWLRSWVEPYAPELAYTVLSPAASSRLDTHLVSRELERIVSAKVSLRVPKVYPHGSTPNLDAAELAVEGSSIAATTIAWRSFPRDRAHGLLTAARRAAESPASSGMGALVPRTQRVLQLAIAPLEGGDPRAAIALAAAFAQLCLGPVLPPDAARLVGPASLRAALAARDARE